jgi:hypothetical protein
LSDPSLSRNSLNGEIRPEAAMTKMKRAMIEIHLARLAAIERVHLDDPRIRAARRDALLYASEGMPAGEAVDTAAVHAFRWYGLPRR